MDSIDKKFEASSEIKFYPFIGEKYFDSKEKILVLGESHYGSQEKNLWSGFTRTVLQDDYFRTVRQGKSNRWIKCFRNTASMLEDSEYGQADEAWQRLAFFNFFQEVVGDQNHADKRYINKDLINRSRVALFEVLDILKPNFVIVWGVGKLYKSWLPREIDWVIRDMKVFKYPSNPGSIFWAIRHPSIGFSIRKWANNWQEVRSESGTSGTNGTFRSD